MAEAEQLFERKEDCLRLLQNQQSVLKRFLFLERQVLAATAVREKIEAFAKELHSCYVELKPLLKAHFVKMRNKKVWFDRENAALFPMFEAVALPVFGAGAMTLQDYKGLFFEGYHFLPMTQNEFKKSFLLDSNNPYLQSRDGFTYFPKETYNTVALTREVQGNKAHWCWVNGNDGWYNCASKVTLIPIYRFEGEDSPALTEQQVLDLWLMHGLIPDALDWRMTEKYQVLMRLWKSSYLVFSGGGLCLKEKTFLMMVLSGKMKEHFFQYMFDWASELGNTHPKPVNASQTAVLPLKEEHLSPKARRKMLMDEKMRIGLSREVLSHIVYPKEVYYDGGLLVDTFINQRGNYVQGYVPAGIYPVASVNASNRTVLLKHSKEAQKVFQRNPICHTAFETFSVPFSHVFVSRDLLPQTKKEAEMPMDYGKVLQDLQGEQNLLEKRISVLETQMKALQSVKDPVADSLTKRRSVPARPVGTEGNRTNSGRTVMPGGGPTQPKVNMTPPAVPSVQYRQRSATSAAAPPERPREARRPDLHQDVSAHPTDKEPAAIPQDDLTFLDWQPSPRPAAVPGQIPAQHGQLSAQDTSGSAPRTVRTSSRRRGAERANDRRAAMAERRAAERRRNRRVPGNAANRPTDTNASMTDHREL